MSQTAVAQITIAGSNTYRCPAFVNLSVKIHIYLHVKKKGSLKVHMKVHMNLNMNLKFHMSLQMNLKFNMSLQHATTQSVRPPRV